MGTVDWVRVTPARPCPICAHDHWCSVSPDGARVFCMREPSERRGSDGQGWIHEIAPAGRNGHTRQAAASVIYTGPIVRHPLHDAAGLVVAVHCRRPFVRDGEPGKKMWWELPDGTSGTGVLKKAGLTPVGMPLYGVETLVGAAPGAVVVVCEGEKDADAIHGLGLLAVGTVTGAGSVPDAEVLRPLVDFDVCLWPDNDDEGRAHMAGVGQRLVALGARVRVLSWSGAPEKGGAADFAAAGLGKDELRDLYRAAVVIDPAALPAAEPPAEQRITDDPHLTDLGNAGRLVARHGPDLRWWSKSKRWLVWKGHVWDQSGETDVQERAKETALSIYDESVAASSQERAEALRKWAKTSESARTIGAMILLARSDEALTVDADKLDGDPWLFNVQNGTLELRTGAFREHRREDLITKVSPVVYEPAAACPRWLAYLDRIFAKDVELIGFVQRAAGYALTGVTGERVMFILFGSGHNGKTVFVEVMTFICGEYATVSPVETLIAKKGDRGIPNDVARLKSARFVAASETEQGDKLAESFIKKITGGDRVAARFLNAEWFDFTPQLKLFLATNHRPQISGTDPAIWDRIRLIPFEVEIPEAERDKGLTSWLTMHEAAGILNWALEGCRRWQEEGLAAPEKIRRATDGYRVEEDVLGIFIEDCCDVQPLVSCSHADLYKAFEDWVKAHGEEKMSSKAFSQRLVERRGIRRSRTESARGWSGIRPIGQQRGRQEDGLE